MSGREAAAGARPRGPEARPGEEAAGEAGRSQSYNSREQRVPAAPGNAQVGLLTTSVMSRLSSTLFRLCPPQPGWFLLPLSPNAPSRGGRVIVGVAL